MAVLKWMLKLALFPLLLLLILAQWVGIFLTTFSTVLTNLLAGLLPTLLCSIRRRARGKQGARLAGQRIRSGVQRWLSSLCGAPESDNRSAMVK